MVSTLKGKQKFIPFSVDLFSDEEKKNSFTDLPSPECLLIPTNLWRYLFSYQMNYGKCPKILNTLVHTFFFA